MFAVLSASQRRTRKDAWEGVCSIRGGGHGRKSSTRDAMRSEGQNGHVLSQSRDCWSQKSLRGRVGRSIKARFRAGCGWGGNRRLGAILKGRLRRLAGEVVCCVLRHFGCQCQVTALKGRDPSPWARADHPWITTLGGLEGARISTRTLGQMHRSG